SLTYVENYFSSSRGRHTRSKRDWSSDVCSSDLFLQVGQVTPIFFSIGFVFRHSGKLEQAINFPYLPILYTIGCPHFSQSIPAGSSLISIDSISFSALSSRSRKSW